MKELADSLPITNDNDNDNDEIILSMNLVYEILEYIHSDFHYILHKKIPNDNKDIKEKISIGLTSLLSLFFSLLLPLLLLSSLSSSNNRCNTSFLYA